MTAAMKDVIALTIHVIINSKESPGYTQMERDLSLSGYNSPW